ncbi:MAG: thioredoxin domain-containing protein [Spirochaetales bacterium]|nr:thioredoxin domain-containing protein [Spirochaetales bacterium]
MLENHSGNLLSGEGSPHLQQHAENPVHWHPWNEEAFELAEKEDKPVFLSIGYASCHWCHRMERESFSDEHIAQLLNSHFVSIKVDREERPDLDFYFNSICRLFIKKTGSPLTIIMTPHKMPFFASTYLPKEPILGQIGLVNLLPKIIGHWKNERETLINTASTIMDQLGELSKALPEGDISQSIFKKTFKLLEGNYDKEYGGFSLPPKYYFPQHFWFLLRYYFITKEKNALSMTVKTLTHIRWGGVFDHIEQGFHKLSTDARWKIPYFEKMLYDQALLIYSYAQAYQMTKKLFFKDVCYEIGQFLDSTLSDQTGAYYTAVDAESEGREGKYYIWNYEELERVIDPKDMDIINFFFNASREGNLNDEDQKDSRMNLLFQCQDDEAAARDLGLPLSVFQKTLAQILDLLRKERQKRPKPFIDKKILMDWNSLVLGALSYSGRVFNDRSFVKKAEKLSEFLTNFMVSEDGYLIHRLINGEQAVSAFLSDYAFFIWAHIELFNASLNVKYLATAYKYLNQALELFNDDAFGGFYYARARNASEIMRQKEYADGFVPSGNSFMLSNLIYFYYFTANKKYKKMADRLIQQTSGLIEERPMEYTSLISSLFSYHGYHQQIIFTGDINSELAQNMINHINQYFTPQYVFIPKNPETIKIAPFLDNYPNTDKPVFYICREFACLEPVDSVEKLEALLSTNKPVG